MAASKEDISRWFEEGIASGATHVIVVCDTFDHEDYPVFVDSGNEDVHARASEFDGKHMQRVMEVYSLSLDKAEQMGERSAFHYD